MVNIISAILIASLLMIQGIGGSGGGIGGKPGGIGGSAPVPAPVASVSNFTATNGVTNVSTTLTLAGGEFVSMYYFSDATVAPTSVVDSNGSISLTPVLSSTPFLWNTGSNRSVGMYCLANAPAGTNTIKITFASTTLIAQAVTAFTGASTSACVTGGGGSIDVVATPIAIASSSTTLSCNSLTTTQTNDALFVGGGAFVTPVPTAGSGFTVTNSMTTVFHATETAPAGAVSTYTPTFAYTGGTGHTAVCLAMAIKHV